METFQHIVLPFAGGIILALGLASLIRVLLGVRLNLYFVHRGNGPEDQMLLAVTAPHKKSSIWKSLTEGRWRENIELTLGDHSGRDYRLLVRFGLWHRFHIQILDGDLAHARLDKKKVEKDRSYFLREGQRLKLGDREFIVHVTPSQMEKRFHRDFSAAHF